MFCETGDRLNQVFDQSSVNMGIVNRDNHPIAIDLVHYLDYVHELTWLDGDLEALQDALFFRDVQYILIIPVGFGAAFEEKPE